MLDLKETARQFIMSNIFGLWYKVLSLLLSLFLDNYMDDRISNLIGLIVNASLDFFMMEHVFKVDIKDSKHFVYRYMISIITGVIVAQLFFMGIYQYTKTRHPKWFKDHWKGAWVTFFRWLSGALSYGFVEFPLDKFWVFHKYYL